MLRLEPTRFLPPAPVLLAPPLPEQLQLALPLEQPL